VPCHADRMPVAGQANPRGKMAGVIFCRPDAVLRHLHRREPEPLSAGGAVKIPIQPGMVREDLQAAANKQDQEQEIDIVGNTQPGGKAVRPRRYCWSKRPAEWQRR
jgi:hypothetical protein